MKEKIIEYLKSEENKKTDIEELKDVLHVSASNEFKELIKAVNQMLDEAVLIENSKHEITLIENTNYLVGTLDLKERGFGFVIPNDPSANDIFISKENMNDAMNRDLVLVHVTMKRNGTRQEGEIKRILDRNYTHVIGVLVFIKGQALLRPDDKTIKQDVVIKKENLGGAQKDDVLRAEIINYSYKGKIECKVSEILGNKNDAGVDVLSKILKHDVDPLFPPEVLEAAKQFGDVTKEDYNGRRDLTNEKIITIDGDDSKDFDDAVVVKKLANGNYHLGVHIADVSHYVTQDSILDKEAYARGTSIYMPGRVIPMLPERLSNGICSLVPHEERLTISCDMEITPQGKIANYEIYPSVIKSYQRMTYAKINKIFLGDVDLAEEYVDLVEMFYDMRNLAKVLKKNREKAGSIHFDNEESYIVIGEDGRVEDIRPRERGVSENIIEEFMLKANQVVAEHIYWLNLPFIYRTHDKPKEEKLERLLRMANALGLKVKAKSEISHHELQKLLQAVEGKDSEKGINLLVLRSMQKAIYSELSLGHYGLNFEFYTHFTSPIRRYPDLIVHRLLREYLFKEIKSMEVIDYYSKNMHEIASHTSASERKAVMLERDVVDMKKAEYISKYINKRFDGIINSVTGFGLYVSLPNTVEGLVHISALQDDYYIYDDELMMLVGERRKKMYRVGDKVRVQVVGANISEGEVDFKIV
jgi:ribonuclease R